MTYLLLKRAFDNFGDYLIFERALNLIKENNKSIDLIFGDASRPLDDQFDLKQLEELKAVIIPGGPGVSTNTYPEVYPLSDVIFNNNIPVYMLGVGSNVFMGLENYPEFSDKTNYLLKYINKFAPIGTRDNYTKNYLTKLGFDSVMNGCPAWYDLDYFGERIGKEREVKNVLFSVPGSNTMFHNQFLYLLKNFMKKYSNYNYYVSFNHGIKEPPFSDLKNAVKRINENIEILDMSGSTKKATRYDEMDIHIGYRVHTHIYFLSHRKPSIILAEDSRGIGVMDTLQTGAIKCWNDKDRLIKYKSYLNRKFKKGVFGLGNSKDVLMELSSIFDGIISNEFTDYNDVFEVMEKQYYNSMKKFIQEYIV